MLVSAGGRRAGSDMLPLVNEGKVERKAIVLRDVVFPVCLRGRDDG